MSPPQTEQPPFEHATAHAPLPSRLRGKLSRLHVPEDCQGHQRDRDDPQNDVFTAVFFFCHEKEYTTPEFAVQVPR
jgi:hypothetical protein